VVVTYNRKSLLVECLNSLVKQTHIPSVIYVIDNNSSDGTEAELENNELIKNSLIKYIKLPVNTGGAGGFNEGIKFALESDVDWIWLMDDDVVPFNDCLEILLKNSGDYQVLQPIRLYENQNFVGAEARIINLVNPFKNLKQGVVKSTDIINNIQIECVPFEGPLIKVSTIKKIGLPDRGYFIMADDTEYSIRVIKEGGKILLVKDAKMIRKIFPVNQLNYDWKSYYFFRNLILLDIKHAGYLFAVTRATFSMVKLLIASLIHWRNFKSYRVIIKSYIDGVFGIKTDSNYVLKIYK